MSNARNLQVGASVTTDHSGKITSHTITARKDGTMSESQSGVMFKVTPVVDGSTKAPWMDADWFEAVQPDVADAGSDSSA